jgi:methylmalonyl-CoA mutase N-terminal domain/subunit
VKSQAQVEAIQASAGAFAAVLGGTASGAVKCWGDPAAGGDARCVQEQLRNVQQIQAAEEDFFDGIFSAQPKKYDICFFLATTFYCYYY